MSKQPRSTATRDRHRAMIRRNEPPCHLCGQPIDYTLPYLDPFEFTVDHVIPLAKGGPDTIENKAAAHRQCNRDKSDGTQKPKRRPAELVTSRSW